MIFGSLAKLVQALLVAAVLLGLLGGARADAVRPAAAGTGEAVAWVHLRGGQHVTFRAAGKQFPAQVGTSLLRTDVLEVPAGEFVVVKLRNGYVVKIDEDTTLTVSGIVSLDAPPTTESLASQLDRVLTREERGRAERIAATQARLAGADSVAPQSSAAAPVRAAAPAPAEREAPASSAPAAESDKKSAAPERRSARPPALSRGLESEASEEARELSVRPLAAEPAVSPFAGAGTSPGGGGGASFSRGLGVSGGVGAGTGGLAGAAAGAARDTAPPSGVVKFGELEVAGALDKAAVTRTLKLTQSQLRACYQRGLQANPTLTGSLVLKLVVGIEGGVAMVEIASSKIVIPIERCAVNAATHWRFPPAKGKGKRPTTVTVPIFFALSAS